jgi:hypothetical protein
MYESGLDNSPLYDDVPFNEAACTLELADVMLNSYYALDCECLARIAACLGRGRDAAAYSRELSRMRELINASLWDEEAGIYKNLHWDGRHSPRLSPGSFFPLLAGVADRRRAKRLVEEHLLNEAEFWGPFVLPSIARCDPAFRDNDYWRGRIWGPFNFLVAEGLRRYRYDEVACAFAKRSLDLFLRNWQGDGGVYENYNVTTGEGGDVWNAARLYHWGGLLAYTGVQELIDSELGGYLRFGSVHLGDARVSNFQLGGARYDVALSDGLEVKRNGEPYLACSTRAIVRLPLADARAPLEITASTPARLSLQRCPAMERSARINGERLIDAVVQGDVVTVTW